MLMYSNIHWSNHHIKTNDNWSKQQGYILLINPGFHVDGELLTLHSSQTLPQLFPCPDIYVTVCSKHKHVPSNSTCKRLTCLWQDLLWLACSPVSLRSSTDLRTAGSLGEAPGRRCTSWRGQQSPGKANSNLGRTDRDPVSCWYVKHSPQQQTDNWAIPSGFFFCDTSLSHQKSNTRLKGLASTNILHHCTV